MKHEFTAIIEKGEDGWWVASCPEVPGAIGQGRTLELVREDLGAAIELMLAYRLDKAIAAMGSSAMVETIIVG